MKYDFDEIVDRSKNRSAKYDERVKNFGTDDVIPLWIADMDFKTAQPIIDACVKKAEEGIWGYTSGRKAILRRMPTGRRSGTAGGRIRRFLAGASAWCRRLRLLCVCLRASMIRS